jgi:hypothetical protein
LHRSRGRRAWTRRGRIQLPIGLRVLATGSQGQPDQASHQQTNGLRPRGRHLTGGLRHPAGERKSRALAAPTRPSRAWHEDGRPGRLSFQMDSPHYGQRGWRNPRGRSPHRRINRRIRIGQK